MDLNFLHTILLGICAPKGQIELKFQNSIYNKNRHKLLTFFLLLIIIIFNKSVFLTGN